MNVVAAALPCLALSICALPGIKLETTGLGQSAIADQARQMISFDEEYATRFTNEWFAKRCIRDELAAAQSCAQELGMTCPPATPSEAGVICDYDGLYSTQALSYIGSPSLSSTAVSPPTQVVVTMQLRFVAKMGALMEVHRRLVTEKE